MAGEDGGGSGWGQVAGGLAGGIISGAFNAYQASENRDFQKRMSDTAHRREIDDLRAAGLNPILSSKYGGSSTPPGSAASVAMPDLGESYRKGKQQPQEMSLLSAQQRLVEANIRDVNSSATLKDTQANDITAQQQTKIELMLAQMSAALESGELSVTGARKMKKEMEVLEEQRQKLLLENKHSAYGLQKAYKDSKFYEGTGGTVAPWLSNILDKLKLPTIRTRR